MVVWDSINGDEHPSVQRVVDVLSTATHILVTAAPSAGSVSDSAIRSTKINAVLTSDETKARVEWVG